MTSVYKIIHFCGIYSLHNIQLIIITYHISYTDILKYMTLLLKLI